MSIRPLNNARFQQARRPDWPKHTGRQCPTRQSPPSSNVRVPIGRTPLMMDAVLDHLAGKSHLIARFHCVVAPFFFVFIDGTQRLSLHRSVYLVEIKMPPCTNLLGTGPDGLSDGGEIIKLITGAVAEAAVVMKPFRAPVVAVSGPVGDRVRHYARIQELGFGLIKLETRPLVFNCRMVVSFPFENPDLPSGE